MVFISYEKKYEQIHTDIEDLKRKAKHYIKWDSGLLAELRGQNLIPPL